MSPTGRQQTTTHRLRRSLAVVLLASAPIALANSIPEEPMDPVLLLHLAMVAILMILLPFSKLLHIPGIFFSPTRNQVDNPREKRHLVEWARKLEES